MHDAAPPPVGTAARPADASAPAQATTEEEEEYYEDEGETSFLVVNSRCSIAVLILACHCRRACGCGLVHVTIY